MLTTELFKGRKFKICCCLYDIKDEVYKLINRFVSNFKLLLCLQYKKVFDVVKVKTFIFSAFHS